MCLTEKHDTVRLYQATYPRSRKNVRLQRQAYFLNRSDPITIMGFLAIIKLAEDNKNNHGVAAMCVLPFFGNNVLVRTLNSRLSTAPYFTLVLDAANTTEPLIQKKLLRSYTEAANYLLKKFETEIAIAKINSKILPYIQLAHMTPVQYANNYSAKSCKVADIYDESTLNNIFIQDVDPSTCYRLWRTWATHTQAHMTNTAFKAQPLISNSKRSSQTGQHQQTRRIQQDVWNAYLDEALCPRPRD